jgi:hypothetical protein
MTRLLLDPVARLLNDLKKRETLRRADAFAVADSITDVTAASNVFNTLKEYFRYVHSVEYWDALDALRRVMVERNFLPAHCAKISKEMGFKSNVLRNIMLHKRPPQKAVLRKLETLIVGLEDMVDLKALYEEAMYEYRGGFTANQPPRKKHEEEETEDLLTLEEEEEEISIEQEDKLVESQKMALIIKLLEGKKLSEVITVSKSVGMSAEELLPILQQMYE